MRDAVVEEVDGVTQVVSPGMNPWGIKFSTMFHMSNDSYLFQDQPAEGLLPLFEAKLIHQFDHRWATYTPEGDRAYRVEAASRTAEWVRRGHQAAGKASP
jgi:hypothetical protein